MELAVDRTSVRDAWNTAFADVNVQEMEADFRKHLLNRYETLVLRTPYKPVEVVPDLVRPMSPADVHLLWARLRRWSGTDLTAARQDIAQAKQLAPNSAEVHYIAGLLEISEGNLMTAKAELQLALRVQPEDERFLVAILQTPIAARDVLFTRLTRVATSAIALNTVAAVYLMTAQHDLALGFAERAIRTDATCSHCFITLGRVLAAKGRYTEALAATETALSLLTDGQRDRDLEDQRDEQAQMVAKLRAKGKK